MGKGDRKTKRGKIFAGSFGVRRRKKKVKQSKNEIQEKTAKTKKSKI